MNTFEHSIFIGCPMKLVDAEIAIMLVHSVRK